MSPDIGKAAFRIAAFIVVSASVLLFFLDRDTAEFYITVASLVLGLLMVLVIWLFIRFGSK